MHYSSLIKIIVADQHKIIKEGIINLLNSFPNLLVVDEAENGRELIEKYIKSCPDLIITDIDMVPISGTNAIADIVKIEPKIKVLFLSANSNDVQVNKVFSIGYYSIVSKSIGVSELVYAINLIMSGEYYFGREFSKAIIEVSSVRKEESESKQKNINSLEQLSKREEEIVLLLASGLTTQEIAERLFISKRTVDTHRLHIIQKFNLRSSADLLKFAFKYCNEKEIEKS